MRIGIVSDLHLAYHLNYSLASYKERALRSILTDIDCLILGGDNAEPEVDFKNYRTLFRNLRNQSGLPIGFITGNHCLFGHVLRKGVTLKHLEGKFEEYSSLAEEYGIAHLEKENLIFDGLVIGGTYGHYDGTLDRINFEEDSRTVSQLVDSLVDRLNVPPSAKKLLITHCVPNKAMIGRPDGPVQDKYTPYAGSLKLEEAILRIKPDWHFCGHTHAYAQSTIGQTHSFNLGTDYENFFYFVLDTNDSSVTRFEKRLSL